METNEPELITEQIKEKKKLSKRKILSVHLNPLKHGEYSRLPKEMVQYIKEPDLMPIKIFELLGEIEEDSLDTRTKIVYINLLLNVFKTLTELKYIEPPTNNGPDLLTKEEVERTIEVLKEYEDRIAVIRDKDNNPTGLITILKEQTLSQPLNDEVNNLPDKNKGVSEGENERVYL